MKIKFEIKSITGSIIFSYEKEKNTIKETVEKFLKENIGKTIESVDLSNLDLRNIDFDNSSFDNSSFDNSRFYNSSFDNCRFYNSSFYNSRFDNSSFYNSRFDNETILNIIKNDQLKMFNYYKNDLWSVLLKAKKEIQGLKEALTNGKIDGSKYEGECSCLKGTIASIRNCNPKAIPFIKADPSEPSEQWFMLISPGMTPENSEVVKLTLAWIEEFEIFLTIK